MSELATKNARTARKMLAVAIVMVTFAVGAVPFYDWFCRVTGYAGATVSAEANTSAPLEQTVRVAFDANVDPGMPWEFHPEVQSMDVRIGETVLAFYKAENTATRPVAGTASFNVAPDSVGAYFTKIDCFCFTEQVLQPGQSVDMPVTFYIDPAILEDEDASKVSYITLSYTFHETPLPEDQANLAKSDGIGEKTASE